MGTLFMTGLIGNLWTFEQITEIKNLFKYEQQPKQTIKRYNQIELLIAIVKQYETKLYNNERKKKKKENLMHTITQCDNFQITNNNAPTVSATRTLKIPLEIYYHFKLLSLIHTNIYLIHSKR